MEEIHITGNKSHVSVVFRVVQTKNSKSNNNCNNDVSDEPYVL